MFRMLLGMPPKKKAKKKEYEIKPQMTSPDTIEMDMESFIKSKVVQNQLKAAKKVAKRATARA